MRKLTRQAKICTPPGGEVIAKICVLRSKDLYSRIETGRALPRVRQHEVRQSHIGCRAFEQPFGLRPLSLIAGFLLVLAGRMSGQLACYGTGACWARLRKFALPTPRYLRKYAQETSPVADCENMHTAKIILTTTTTTTSQNHYYPRMV